MVLRGKKLPHVNGQESGDIMIVSGVRACCGIIQLMDEE